MIFMPIIMVSPFLALALFYFLPLRSAIPIYIVILMLAGFFYYLMIKSMRAKIRTGLEKMIGGEARVLENIDPEGKVSFEGEIWTARARGKRFAEGSRVRILDVKGLVLFVGDPDSNDDQRTLSA
jgi:membrane-bound ClpP family serine protease